MILSRTSFIISSYNNCFMLLCIFPRCLLLRYTSPSTKQTSTLILSLETLSQQYTSPTSTNSQISNQPILQTSHRSKPHRRTITRYETCSRQTARRGSSTSIAGTRRTKGEGKGGEGKETGEESWGGAVGYVGWGGEEVGDCWWWWCWWCCWIEATMMMMMI